MVGRPKGSPKTGGRQKGTANKPTFDTQAVSSPDGRLTPLGYMLGILNDKDMPDKHRKWAARTAMPYCHPKLRAALADTLRGVTVEIQQFTNEEALLQIERDAQERLAEYDTAQLPEGMDKTAPDPGGIWAAESAMPYCHAPIQPASTKAGVVDVQVRHVTHEQRLAELDALAEIDARAPIEKNNREQSRPVEQVQPVETAMDRMEADWFNPDSRHVAHGPPPSPIPAPTPPPQPPVLALGAAPVPCETGPIHRANGNGAHRPPQRVNGHPRRVNGAVVRRSDDEIRNISDRRRALLDYPSTHPVHGIV